MTKLAEVEELVRRLPVEDRLRLLESTWDSLDGVIENGSIPDWHKAEIDAGIAEYNDNPGSGLPLTDSMAHIRGQLKK
jgi:putative addiction module component (TIGR02574 family)